MKDYIFCFLLLFTSMMFSQTPGCPDPLATNYNSEAIINDGSCTYDNISISASSSVELPEVMVETSGLIYWNDKLWTHNDNSDINLYSFNPNSPDTYESYELTGTENIDQEEISQDSNYIYLGDFGNNVSGNRTNLYILRIDKQSLITGTPLIDTIFFSYSNQTDFNPTEANETDFDCESFIVSTDSIFLFTKQWVSEKTALYSLSKYPGVHVASFKAELDVSGLITGAYYNRSKKLVVLSGYSSYVQPFFYLLYDFSGNDFFSGNKRKISFSASLHQVEGIASNDNLIYYASNEKLVKVITIKQKLHELDLSPYLNDYLNSLVIDSNPPVISSNHADTVIYANNNCIAEMPVFTNLMIASDDITLSENLIYTQSIYPGSDLNSGVHEIFLRAYDESDNYHEISFYIEVIDTISPTIEYESLLFQLVAEDDCTATLPDLSEILNIYDNCTEYNQLEINQTPASGTFCVGEENICSFIVTDESGNFTTIDFVFFVIDTTAPTVECPIIDSITLPYGENTYIVNGTEFDPLSYDDNCEIATLVNDYNNESSLANAEFLCGSTLVKWTITDSNENVVECEFYINISMTSIESELIKKIQLFPNPASNTVNIINSDCEIENIQITDVYGRILNLSSDYNRDQIIYDISILENGIYFVNVQTNSKTLKYKFIKS
ncbi:MAG: HYR domain-containing protein [Bacteroidales bacterium]|nr:HYR domain-containing protein [Bacteroidales bacterium]